MIDVINALCRPTESINVFDFDDTENFLNDQEARWTSSILNSSSVHLTCNRGSD